MRKRAKDLLAQQLRVLRLMKGWSQEHLAEVSGLHRTHISLIERCECNISLNNAEKLADAFGLTLIELLNPPDAARLGEQLLEKLNPATKRKES
jgi:transcriptional regulator with XRE-family HTH domain